MRTSVIAAAAVACVSLAGLATVWPVDLAGPAGLWRVTASPPAAPMRNGHVRRFWPAGGVMADVTYRNDAYEGEYRTWYASGRPYELRHYVDGRESGLQQSWTEAGELYLNYVVREGRRYGLVNASPCNSVGETSRASVRTPRAGAPRGAEDHATHWPDEHVANWPDEPSLPYYDAPSFSPRWTKVAHRIADFDLPTQTGTHVSSGALSGHPYVASFIYTKCAAVCPLVIRQLSRVQAAIAGRDARILSFSVTPDDDTPAVLAQFGRERGIDPRVWSLVTGSRREIYTLARTSYFADDNRIGNTPDDASAFLHTEKLLLVDGHGRLRGVYNGTQPHAVDQLIADVNLLSGSH